MFSFGGSELLVIAAVVLLLFGPDKIPQLARTIGRFTKEFNKYKDIMESTIRMEIDRAEPQKDEMTVEERIAKAAAASDALYPRPAEEDAEAPATSDATPAPAARAVAAPAADEADDEEDEA